MSQSIVWKFFTKCDGGKQAQCTICFKKLKTGGGTTNLHQHLKNKHPVFLDDKGKQFCRPSTSSVVHLEDETSLGSTTSESDSTSKSLNRSRSPIPTSLRQMTLLQTHQRTSSYESGGKRATEITNSLIYMLCKDNMPHSTVEKMGFMHFAKTTVPIYKLPGRKTVTEIVSSKYTAAIAAIQNQLATVVYMSLSADTCTIQNCSKGFLVVTAHFVNPQENKLETVMLGVRRLRESHTGDYIASEISALCDIFHIDKTKILGICTDGGANMMVGVRKMLGEGKNVYCFAHLLNLIVSDGLEDSQNLPLKTIIKEVKAIVTFGRQSNLFMDKLRAEQERDGSAEGNILLLVQSVPTRWNSTYKMLKRFLTLTPIIAQILANPATRNAPRMVSGADIELITEVVEILLPFEEATKEISGSEYITGSIPIPLLVIIERTLNKFHLKNETAKILRNKLLNSLQERGPRILQNPLLCHATLSDPRFKKLYMHPLIAGQAISSFSQEIQEYLKGIGKLSPVREMLETEKQNPLWASHDDEVVNKSGSVEIESSFPSELKLYLQQPLLPRQSDPFVFWEQSKSCMPGSSYIALKYLCLVGSSVASERLVSTINDVVSDERSRLTDQHIIERVFLNRLDRKYWPMD